MKYKISKHICSFIVVFVLVLFTGMTLIRFYTISVQRDIAAEVYVELQMISGNIQTYLWEHPAVIETTDWMDESLREVIRRHGDDVLTVPISPPVPYLVNPVVTDWLSEADPSPILVVSPVKTLAFDRMSQKVYLGINARGDHVKMDHLPEWAKQ